MVFGFSLRGILSIFLSLQMVLFVPSSLARTRGASSPAAHRNDLDQQAARGDSILSYWGKLDHFNPVASEFALGEEITPGNKPLWQVDSSNPVLDQDPFFIKGQKWQRDFSNKRDCESYCFSEARDGNSLTIHHRKFSNSLAIDSPFRFALETDRWIFMVSRTDEVFKAKTPGDSEPGQGLFYVNKKDFSQLNKKMQPVPVFHFPLPGPGWVGDKVVLTDLSVMDRIVVRSSDGVTLDLDVLDIEGLENSSRRNFVWTQYQTLLSGTIESSGIALPMPKSTLSFGLILSGLNNPGPVVIQKKFSLMKKAKMFFSSFLVQEAVASEGQTNRHKLVSLMDQRLKQMEAEGRSYLTLGGEETRGSYLYPALLYGGTAVGAVLAAQSVEFGSLIVGDIGTRISIVLGLFGVALVAAVTMRYAMYRDRFQKSYPAGENESLATRVNRHHKTVLNVYIHNLYFGLAGPGQAIRHTLDYLKDRYFPSNKVIQNAWEATMGFQIKQSSRLPVNWKTFYLGSVVMGMSDSILVALDLLIFTPWLMKVTGIGAEIGVTAAAFASAEVLRNFVGYLQSGAHGYAMDVKLIHMKKAERDANRRLRSLGLDPRNPKNGGLQREYINEYLQRTYLNLGLPGEKEFLFDPITVLEASVARGGFNLDRLKSLPDEKKAEIGKTDFLFAHRNWGKVTPALKLALKHVQELKSLHPTSAAEEVERVLLWASNYKGFFTPSSLGDTLRKAGGASVLDKFYRNELHTKIAEAQDEMLRKNGRVGVFGLARAAALGTYRYLRQDQIDNVRDIRFTLMLMSTTASYKDVIEYLPESWVRVAGGSLSSAQAAAELFHRALFTIQEGKNSGLRPDSFVQPNYGVRAEEQIRAMAESDRSLEDPFLREVRRWEVINEIERADRARYEMETFEPEKMGPWERRQWRSVRALIAPALASFQTDSEISRKWQSSFKIYSTLSGKEVADIESSEQREWVEKQQRRMIYVSQFARRLGLYLSNVEASEVLDRVIANAAKTTADELSLENNRHYLERLEPREREFYEARVFYEHFVSSYVEATSVGEKMSALSPEFPGRLQGVRINMNGKGKLASGPILLVTRFIESMFPNDAEVYSAGFKASFDRNIPFAADLFNNFVRSLRILPYFFTFGYLTYYYIWQIHMPYSMFVFMLMFGFTATAMVEMNNRMMRFFNIKPMNDVASKLTYSWVHSRLTNPLIMIQLAFASVIAGVLTAYNLAIGAVVIGTIFIGKLTLDEIMTRLREKRFRAQAVIADGRLQSSQSTPKESQVPYRQRLSGPIICSRFL